MISMKKGRAVSDGKVLRTSLFALMVAAGSIGLHAPALYAKQATSATCVNAGSYTNVNGKAVLRPEQCKGPSVPAGASAQCRDGSFSFSQNHRGTCSGHGGVARWL